ncbi:hypothetical protein EXIGLDRAFT_721801 [Exidia glandulosa HHB12029]|uniref:SMP-30/Gluconolactonase/LRE-like region domain-containing protein n=1 Tax=Exidia glandulosa HHB12029 TaxID=1314781 RepID=A0A165QH68_EXIGL|nr:hypothetical protein EXIGLDRAFT_721801 [Exidia glandulosa HHB12029]
MSASLHSLVLGYHAAAVQEVAVFPVGSWLENLAVRDDGHILVTRIDEPTLWSIDPSTGHVSLVTRFPDATSAFGITHLGKYVFAVAVGNYSLASSKSTSGTYSVYTVDFRSASGEIDAPVLVLKAASVPSASIINGLTTFDAETRTVLAADTNLGLVYKIDTTTGKSSTVLTGEAFEAPPAIPMGVNGLQYDATSSTLYFSNTGTGTLCRVPLALDGSAAGRVETLAKDLHIPDDFILLAGNALIAVNQIRSIVQLSLEKGVDRSPLVLAGGPESQDFANPTAVALSRSGARRHLYVTTGGMRDKDGTAVTGGKVLAIELPEVAYKSKVEHLDL